MLRITSLPNAAAAEAYYKVSDYFLDGQERPGVVHGGLARHLGLTPGETTTPEAFRRLCRNQHPETGDKLSAYDRTDRRVGWDINFHCPKSVSVLRQVAGDERIDPLIDAAVLTTMKRIEADAEVRVRAGGAFESAVTGNMVYSLHRHLTARPVNGKPDPHDHVHCVCWNYTLAHDGQVKALELGDIRSHTGFYEAVFHAELSRGMAELGYGVQRHGKFWEVAGIEKATLDKFSRRTAQVEAAAKARGIERPDLKDTLGAKTREKKSNGLTLEQLKAEWVSRLTAQEKQQLGSLTQQQAELPTVGQAVRHALEHCFERSSVMAPRKVYETSLRFGYGSATVEAVVAESRRQGLLIKDGQSTTKAALARERRLIRWARDNKGAVKPLAPHGPFGVNGVLLTPGQASAVRHVLTSPDRLTLVQGQAGTGKTTLLKSLVAQLDCPVKAVAVSGTAADELREVAPSSTLAAFLASERAQQELAGGLLICDEASLAGTVDMERITQALDKTNARLLLVGDTFQHAAVSAGSPFAAVQKYAGLELARVSEVVRQTGLYKEVAELLARGEINPGLDLLEQMGGVHECGEEERMRAMAADYLWAVSNNLTALAVAPTHEEVDAVNAAVRGALLAAGRVRGEEHELLRLKPVPLTEAERRDAVGLEQAEGLVAAFHRDKGAFRKGQRVAVTKDNAQAVAQAATVSAVYRESRIHLAEGDRIRITAGGTANGHTLRNGSVYQVAGFDKRGDVQLENGWTLPKDWGHWTHAYASTSHASQGKTTDVVLVSMPVRSLAAVGQDTAYVALTRGKRNAYLYTDDLPALREAASRPRPKANAADLFGPTQSLVKQRVTFLSRVRHLARHVLEKVSQLTHKENAHGFER